MISCLVGVLVAVLVVIVAIVHACVVGSSWAHPVVCAVAVATGSWLVMRRRELRRERALERQVDDAVEAAGSEPALSFEGIDDTLQAAPLKAISVGITMAGELPTVEAVATQLRPIAPHVLVAINRSSRIVAIEHRFEQPASSDEAMEWMVALAGVVTAIDERHPIERVQFEPGGSISAVTGINLVLASLAERPAGSRTTPT